MTAASTTSATCEPATSTATRTPAAWITPAPAPLGVIATSTPRGATMSGLRGWRPAKQVTRVTPKGCQPIVISKIPTSPRPRLAAKQASISGQWVVRQCWNGIAIVVPVRVPLARRRGPVPCKEFTVLRGPPHTSHEPNEGGPVVRVQPLTCERHPPSAVGMARRAPHGRLCSLRVYSSNEVSSFVASLHLRGRLRHIEDSSSHFERPSRIAEVLRQSTAPNDPRHPPVLHT